MDESFLNAVEKVLRHEGGYVNDPADPGGETKYGICKRSYPCIDIKSLTREQAVRIYYQDWWRRYGYDMIADASLGAKTFDLAVNMGARQAHKLLQRSVNATSPAGLSVDGILGPLSLEAINNHPHPPYLFAEYRLRAVAFYLDLNKPKYLAGWVRRALD